MTTRSSGCWRALRSVVRMFALAVRCDRVDLGLITCCPLLSVFRMKYIIPNNTYADKIAFRPHACQRRAQSAALRTSRSPRSSRSSAAALPLAIRLVTRGSYVRRFTGDGEREKRTGVESLYVVLLRPGLNRVSVLSFVGEFFGTYFSAARNSP